MHLIINIWGREAGVVNTSRVVKCNVSKYPRGWRCASLIYIGREGKELRVKESDRSYSGDRPIDFAGVLGPDSRESRASAKYLAKGSVNARYRALGVLEAETPFRATSRMNV